MTKWVLLFLVACGPGLARVPMSKDMLVGDASKLRRLMRDSVVNGGLAFDDRACAKDFGTPGDVPADKLDAFARCLAGLHLQRSAREDAIADVIVMQYEPGFEVEARVVDDDGGVLRWIGFASRAPGDPDVPTITRAAFEKLRLAGATALDAAAVGDLELGPETNAAYAWFKVCLDASGAIVKTDAFETTSPRATKAFEGLIATWKLRPFATRGTPIAVCSMLRLAHPVDQVPETLPLPPPPSRSKKRPVVLPTSKLIEGRRIAGTREVVPDDTDKARLQERGNPKISGTFRVCIDDTGAVESVLPMVSTGLPGYDEKIIVTMHDWRYTPYAIDGQPVPVCTYATFIYSQR